jgi:hypothetical protein
VNPGTPYRTTVATIDEVPLFLIPKVIQEQLKQAGGGVFKIRVNRTHYYHFTVTVVRLVKWHRADVIRRQVIIAAPQVEESPERAGVFPYPDTPESEGVAGTPESSAEVKNPAVARTGEVSADPVPAVREGAHG